METGIRRRLITSGEEVAGGDIEVGRTDRLSVVKAQQITAVAFRYE